jgi:hypothetical protein
LGLGVGATQPASATTPLTARTDTKRFMTLPHGVAGDLMVAS